MFAGKRSLSIVSAAALVLSLAVAPLAGAQTQTQPKPETLAVPAGGVDTATVSIFAPKKKPRSRAEERITRISRTTGRSCRFGTDLVDVIGNPTALEIWFSEDEVMQDYYADMGIDNPLYGTEAMAGSGMTGDLSPTDDRIDDIMPIAGAGGQMVTAAEGNAGGCTTSDLVGEAARNDIARHDKSLKDGLAAYDAKDYARALPLFEEGYRKIGYAQAAYMIGKMYLGGLGTKRDVKQAVVWFKRVAEDTYNRADVMTFNPSDPYDKNGRIESDIILATVYMSGTDVPKSPRDARHWYMEADKYGYVPAEFSLGKMAENGFGGPKDLKQAVAYYQKAGEYGFVPAQYELGQLYYNGADGVTQDKTKAGAWLLKAAKAGHPDALYAVARMYELGEGGATVDVPKALVYYKEAAIRGQVDAQTTLGTYLYTGEGGAPKNLETARKLFEMAAAQDDQQAMFNLGVMMVNGEGGPKDLVHAYAWFYVADKGGIGQAHAAMTELAGKMTPEQRAQAEALLNPQAKTN